MGNTMVKTIQGEEYNVLNLQGKAYAPVNQRVESAHKHGGYSMLSCEYKEILGRQVCEVWIEVEGKKFVGTAEIKKTFDRPLEDGQTSALGRALGFAGFNIETAIASAEDMASLDNPSVTVDSEPPRQMHQPKPQALPPAGQKIPTIAEQCAALAKSRNYTKDAWGDLCQQYTANGHTDWQGMKAQLMREAQASA